AGVLRLGGDPATRRRSGARAVPPALPRWTTAGRDRRPRVVLGRPLFAGARRDARPVPEASVARGPVVGCPDAAHEAPGRGELAGLPRRQHSMTLTARPPSL